MEIRVHITGFTDLIFSYLMTMLSHRPHVGGILYFSWIYNCFVVLDVVQGYCKRLVLC